MIVGGRVGPWDESGGSYPWDYRVAYIQSNGTPYFNFGSLITPNNSDYYGDVWEIKMGVPQYTTSDQHLFGSSYRFGLAVYNGKWRPSSQTDWTTNVGPTISSVNPVVYRLDATGMYLFDNAGGNIWSSSRGHSPSITAPISIYVGKMYNDTVRKGTGMTYYVSMWRNGVLMFNLLPCVMGGVVGMYDTVSGTFFGSVVSTQFTPGEKVNDDGSPLSMTK